MNRPIRMLAIGCMVLFLALLVNANYVQFVKADALNDRTDNRRVRDAEFSRERGPILVAGEAAAESTPSQDRYRYQRVYTRPTLFAHITGHYSYIYGASGVELTQNDILSGSADALLVDRVVDMVTDEPPQGGNVLLTLDPAAQRAAHQGLLDLPADSKGAVVAIEPDTGAVLAMSSVPGYDPNVLASHDLGAVQRAWEQLTEDPEQPLLNRAIQNRYPPGSTFKLVTAAAALSDGYTPRSKVTGTAVLNLPLTDRTLGNDSGGDCGGDTISLTTALAVSCNTAFADLGMKLGPEALRDQAEKFGFGSDGDDILDELAGTVGSVFPADPDQPSTAYSAIGQFEVAATPLQMAMVVAGIANDGTVMQPYLVDEVRSPDLDTLSEADPEPLSQAVEPGVAADLQMMMVAVTTDGTGGVAAIPGIDVGSKTGTAQTSEARNPYAWFVSFAPADDPEVAVAVFVEADGVNRDDISGSGLGGPIAKSVMQAVIGP